MSSQDTASIPFTSNHHQYPFKLLELPTELLQLLESDSPPTLYLKSATPSSPTATAYALLTGPDVTYRIQQKNSSNPIMIIEPRDSRDTETVDVVSVIPVPGLTVISMIEDTLELYKQESETEVPVAVKVNKWHEKFAKGRGTAKGND